MSEEQSAWPAGPARPARRPAVHWITDVRSQDRVELTGVIREAGTISVAGSPTWRCVLDDGTGEVDLLFLGRATITGLHDDARCSVQGTAAPRQGRLTVWNPRYQLAPDQELTAELPAAWQILQAPAQVPGQADEAAPDQAVELVPAQADEPAPDQADEPVPAQADEPAGQDAELVPDQGGISWAPQKVPPRAPHQIPARLGQAPVLPATGDGDRPAAGESPASIEASEVVEAAGHFRIYLGVAAGAGKTMAMLDEGHRRARRGTDVVIAFVESHGRPVTQARAEGLEVVPRMNCTYRDGTYEEMDTAAVLERQPRVALVDELAHTNVPGSGPHAKRWEDVFDLLNAGVDVITTVNIQHLESIADTVEEITGIPVRERIPDWVVRRADQVELIDSSPEQLRRRMLHGNIYPQDKVPQALTHFFQSDNLVALREMALRFMADETDDHLRARLASQRSAGRPWETAERIMAAVTPGAGAEAIVRRAARMAARIKADLDIVNITSAGAGRGDAEAMARLHEVAIDVGATWHQLSAEEPVTGLIDFALAGQITQIVIGSSQRGRWRELTSGGSIVARVSRQATQAGIDVHIVARRTTTAA